MGEGRGKGKKREEKGIGKERNGLYLFELTPLQAQLS